MIYVAAIHCHGPRSDQYTQKFHGSRESKSSAGKMSYPARSDYAYAGGSQERPVLDLLNDKRVAIIGTVLQPFKPSPFLGRSTPSSCYVFQRPPPPSTNATTPLRMQHQGGSGV